MLGQQTPSASQVDKCQRGELNFLRLKPHESKMWKDWITHCCAIRMCVCIQNLVYCIINIIVRLSGILFKVISHCPSTEAAEDGERPEMCLSQMCSSSRDDWCSFTSACLSLWTGQCLGSIAWLLKKYYSSEFSVCIWTLHLIRLLPARHGRLGEEKGAACSVFL